MANTRLILQRLGGGLAPALALAWASSGAAQSTSGSVSDFRLPTPTASASPRAQGPVDSDAPVVTPRRTPPPEPVILPSAAPTSAPSPSLTLPRPTPSRAQSAAPSPAQQAPRAQPRAPVAQPTPNAAAPVPTAPVTSAGTAAPTPLPTSAPLPSVPLPSTGGGALAPIAPPVSAPAAETEAPIWPYVVGALVLLAIGAAAFAFQRRRAASAPPVIEFEPPVVTLPPEEKAMQVPAAVPPAEAAAPSPAVAPPEGLALVLDATRMSATLLNTTLAYRLLVTNHGHEAAGPIVVCGDMIAAQAGLPAEAQLHADATIPELHRIPALQPGESATLKGEMRLPLAAITPIRQGAAALFVPLVRFRAQAEQGSGTLLTAADNYVVGEPPAAPNAGLRPFRLDLGPRIYSEVAQRQLAAVA